MTTLPVIRVRRVIVGMLQYAELVVPGTGAASLTMALRVASEAVEALDSRGFDCLVPLFVRGAEITVVHLAVFARAPSYPAPNPVREAVFELGRAAQRESCVKSVRHADAVQTHTVQVAA